MLLFPFGFFLEILAMFVDLVWAILGALLTLLVTVWSCILEVGIMLFTQLAGTVEFGKDDEGSKGSKPD